MANKPALVANTLMVADMVANRHGKYADLEKRRAYMRSYIGQAQTPLGRSGRGKGR
jgi:hypothetical protein